MRWGMLSMVAAVVTIALKFAAYQITGSVGLLSDAIESTVNLITAATALFALWYSVRPVDRTHHFGHEKIEFFASAVEGAMILVASGGIIWYSTRRLLDPQPLEALDLGLAISLTAALINLVVARLLLRVGRTHDSIVLEADGQHLMTDVWTSLGVVVGLALVRVTGIDIIDPIIGIVIAINILRIGVGLLRTSFDGLMDRSLPVEEEDQLRAAIQSQLGDGVTYHALRTRKAGARRFVDLHVLVPGSMPMTEAHRIANRIEDALHAAYPNTETIVHLEPIEDPHSWTDSDLLAVEPPRSGFDLPDFLRPNGP